MRNLVVKLYNSNHNECYICGSITRLISKHSIFVICTFDGCKTKQSVFANTFLHNSKLNKLKLLRLIKLLYIGTGFESICESLSINIKTAERYLGTLKKEVNRRYLSFLNQIGGKDIIVEIDESKFGKNKHHRGHKVEGVWVVGMVERTKERKMVLYPVEKRSAKTLIPLIRWFVHPESIIFSDKWKAYYSLQEYFEHLSVNHSKHFVDPDTGVHTNTIEGNWNGIKMKTPARWRTVKDIKLPLAIAMAKREGSFEEFIFKLIK